ncbi:MAG TPA: hypothetical protein VGF30_15960, partial [Bacteroidia bacterium]
MKKSIIALIFVCLINVLAAQTPVVNVPASVNVKYGTDYPNTSPVWTMENDYYYATWTDKTTNMGRTAIYDKNGVLISTEN